MPAHGIGCLDNPRGVSEAEREAVPETMTVIHTQYALHVASAVTFAIAAGYVVVAAPAAAAAAAAPE